MPDLDDGNQIAQEQRIYAAFFWGLLGDYVDLFDVGADQKAYRLKIDDLDMATKVSVQLQLTDPDLKSRDRVVKKTEKDSLYAAMDVASVWLDRALSAK